MKNQGENKKKKKRNNTFNSFEFIHFTADHILLSNILRNFGKIKF